MTTPVNPSDSNPKVTTPSGDQTQTSETGNADKGIADNCAVINSQSDPKSNLTTKLDCPKKSSNATYPQPPVAKSQRQRKRETELPFLERISPDRRRRLEHTKLRLRQLTPPTPDNTHSENSNDLKLRTSARCCDHKTFSRLLAEETKANTSTPQRGIPLLHLAVQSDNQGKLLSFLLRNKAKLHSSNSDRKTPMNSAASANSETNIEELPKGNPIINSRDQFGSLTPLHHAAKNRNLKITLLLLNHGADINAKDTLGRTPLHTAVACNNTEVAACLLEAGADKTIQDLSGRTAYQISRSLDTCLELTALSPEEAPSLMQSTRKTIRKALTDKQPDTELTGPVRKLPLPTIIKNYLLLDDGSV